jgi:hypothetical protein
MTANISDIEQVVRGVYKSLESPDFSFVQKALDSNPYRELVESLTSNYSVIDNTDPNDDVCFSLELEGGNHKWLLQLSMIGRYAACCRLSSSGHVDEVLSSVTGDVIDDELELRKLLSDHKVRLMTRGEMEKPINLSLINTEPEDVCIYQALFSDTDIYPWGSI